MKIRFFTNACCTYEVDGFKLLADPWLTDSCFEGAWIHDPPITTKPQDLLDVDALYISHLHQDHADPETLKFFDRDIPIVTLGDQFSFCAKHLRRMGFKNVIEVRNVESHSLGPFEVTMFAPFKRHPLYDCEIGNVVDSAMLVRHGDKLVLNCNDNTPDIDSAYALADRYGGFNVAQLNYNNASEYPCCFTNLTDEEKLAESKRCIDRNIKHMAMVGAALKAKYVMPFAGAFKLSKKWEHMNAYLGATTDKEAACYLASKGIGTFTLAEGEAFNVE